MEINIKELRGKTGLSQARFAIVLGVSVASLRRWESGDASPSPMALKRINEIAYMTEDALIKVCSSIDTRVKPISDDAYKTTFEWEGTTYNAVWAPYVINGPSDQVEFYNKLIDMQQQASIQIEPEEYFERLSMLHSVEGVDTSQYKMAAPKKAAKSWSSDYGTHGFHRYVGRFPSHLIRALINSFGATSEDVILDPFCGSGTTLVEARMLGVGAIGIEISPLSAMMSRVKSQFPSDGFSVSSLLIEITDFYNSNWQSFLQNRSLSEITYEEILSRDGNAINQFSNIERWFTKEALLGTSIIVEFILQQTGYIKDFLTIAISAKMRSIGNVDVDVVRAEYRKTPRQDVDVLKLVKSQIKKMAVGINTTVAASENVLNRSTSISVVEGNVLTVDIAENSISHIITSPPYGVESLSYLRTHLLSFRALQPILGVDPYNFGGDVIGSEYLDGNIPDIKDFRVNGASITYKSYFTDLLKKNNTSIEEKRILMMMKFFEDMFDVVERFSFWLKSGGHVAFIIGNKKIGDSIISTDKIITEIFESFGFYLSESIPHKLKTNNSNSQVPWQDRIIENEYVLLFTKGEK